MYSLLSDIYRFNTDEKWGQLKFTSKVIPVSNSDLYTKICSFSATDKQSILGLVAGVHDKRHG